MHNTSLQKICKLCKILLGSVFSKQYAEFAKQKAKYALPTLLMASTRSSESESSQIHWHLQARLMPTWAARARDSPTDHHHGGQSGGSRTPRPKLLTQGVNLKLHTTSSWNDLPSHVRHQQIEILLFYYYSYFFVKILAIIAKQSLPYTHYFSRIICYDFPYGLSYYLLFFP